MSVTLVSADSPGPFHQRAIPALAPTVLSCRRSLSALTTRPFASPLLDPSFQPSHQYLQDLDLSQVTSPELFFSHSRSERPIRHHYSSDRLTWRQKPSACFSFSDDN